MAVSEIVLTKAEQRTKTALAGLIDSKHPVALAVEPSREEAVERTKQFAKSQVEAMTEELAKVENDLEKCAPYPTTRKHGYGWQYDRALSKHRMFSSIVKHRKSCGRPHEPCFVDVSPERVEQFIQHAAERAALDYDAFIVKLCGKIGQCDSAELNGSHVWGHSHLFVVKGDVKETWKTQQIINCSKLGKVFNQWPSRKVKK